MELKDYWRILRRRRRVVYRTFAIVALLSILQVGLSTYQGFNLVEMSLVMTQEAPTAAQLASQIHGLTSPPAYDPAKESLSLGVDVVNNAFTFTDRRAYFDAVSARLSTQYGVHRSWQELQSILDIYPAAFNHMYFKVSGPPADDAANRAIVEASAGVVADYVNHTYHALYPTGTPPHARVWDPLNVQKASHVSRRIVDLALRLAGGLVLGLILAFLWEYLDDYAHDDHDVDEFLGTRTLAVIPTPKRRTA